MSKIDNGGPAFPVHPEMAEKLGCINSQSDAGMTLRDYFAAKALKISWSSYDPLFTDEGGADEDVIAERAYRMADAMLRARDAS